MEKLIILRQLGRWQMRDEGLNDPSKVAESSLKNVYWARVMVGLTGPLHDFNPIQTNFMEIIKGLPHTGAMLREQYRNNNVLVKSFGNSLYDNIIINDTRAHGYGFTNWFYRVWDGISSFVTDPKTAGFNWYVVRQTAWDALHEVALFLGDYIVTTLPYNEGKDIFLEPPRETLYFGPREGQYQASQYLPRMDVKARLKEILDTHSKPLSKKVSRIKGLGVVSDKENADRKFILNYGKTMLAVTLQKLSNLHVVGSGYLYPIPNEKTPIGTWEAAPAFASGDSDYMWSTDERLLPAFVRTLESEGWNRVAHLIKESVGLPRGQAYGYMLNKSDDIPIATLFQLLLNDLDGKYLKDAYKAQAYNYSIEDKIIFQAIVDGEIDYITGTRGGTADGGSSKKGDPNYQRFLYYYPTTDNTSYTAQVKNMPGFYNRLYNPGWGTASPFESIHKAQRNSIFYYMFFFEGGQLGRKIRQGIFKMYPHYLSNIDHAIAEDTYDLMANYVQRQKTGVATGGTGVRIDLENAMNTIGGSAQIFQYKPTVGTHVVNSYEDIIDNSIIATADQMYNHVEVLYDSEPDPTNDISRAEYRAQAWISYDQDPDYLRTYQTYMKNLDPNLFFNTFEANAYIDGANSETQSASMLTQHAIAQQVLMNVMKPMYQGTLTILGNPHIKPWDQVFIHDDSISMYGPIEVEQVVNTISATGGYTTTIIPNLCVTYKSASKAIDDLILSLHATIQTAGLLGTLLKHAATIGAIWFAMKPKMLHPFQGDVGGKLGKYLTAGVVDVSEATEALNKTKKMRSIAAQKTIFKKHMSSSDYKIAAVGAEDYSKLRDTGKLMNKQFDLDIKADLPGSGETGGVKGGKSTTARLNNTRSSLTGKLFQTQADWEAWRDLGDFYKEASETKGKTLNPKTKVKETQASYKKKFKNWQKMTKKHHLVKVTAGPSVSRYRIITKVTRYGTSLDLQLIQKAADGKLSPKALTAAQKTIKDVLKKVTNRSLNGQSLNKLKNRLVDLQRKSLARETRSVMNATLDKSISNLSIRSSLMSGALRVLNWVGWAWTAYEVGHYVWDSLTIYATGKIFMAGLLAGENQLAWIPLEYQGKEYIAGLEGIMGTPRGIDTILWGEFQGDNNQFNRVLSLLEMTMQGE